MTQQSFQGVTYTVDIVFCIDATGSMGEHINRVKQNALQFHNDVLRVCAEKNKKISRLRVKVIAFRDYFAGDTVPMAESPFYELSGAESQFRAFVDTIQADGGGDIPENSLEALALAIKSEWATTGSKRRQVVVMFTDAAAHPLEKAPKPAGYPSGLPGSMAEITNDWENNLHASFKRLILFAPDEEPWSWISSNWANAVHHPAQAGKGLTDIDYGAILEAIQHSV